MMRERKYKRKEVTESIGDEEKLRSEGKYGESREGRGETGR